MYSDNDVTAPDTSLPTQLLLESLEEIYYTHQHQKEFTEKPHPISFLRLLQHWAATTHFKKTHMDNLLRLIHHHRPVIDYNVLPLTGKQLLQIDGRDYAGFISKTPVGLPAPTAFPSTVGSNQNERSPIDAGPSVAAPLRSSTNGARVTSVTRGVRRKKKTYQLPKPVIQREGAKYSHFGLQSAIAGTSIGLLYQNAALLQYINIFKENPALVPICIRKKVNHPSSHWIP